MSDRPGDGRTRRRVRSCQVMAVHLNDLGARAVIGVDGAVWSANSAFCSLVGLQEPALRRLGWRQLVHSADRRYVAAHLVEVLAGADRLREFDARFLPPDGRDVPAHIRVELVRDRDGRQGCFLVEAWATT
jgi:PAS domain S-box-containing protein